MHEDGSSTVKGVKIPFICISSKVIKVNEAETDSTFEIRRKGKFSSVDQIASYRYAMY